VSKSTAKDTWLLGAGPFERGTVHDGWEFAGTKLRLPFMNRRQPLPGPVAAYGKEMLYTRPAPKVVEPEAAMEEGVQQVSGEQDAKPEEAKP